MSCHVMSYMCVGTYVICVLYVCVGVYLHQLSQGVLARVLFSICQLAFGLPMLSGINKSGRILCPEPGEIMVGTSTNFTIRDPPVISACYNHHHSLLAVGDCRCFLWLHFVHLLLLLMLLSHGESCHDASFLYLQSIFSVQAVERGWSTIHCRDSRSFVDNYYTYLRFSTIHYLIPVLVETSSHGGNPYSHRQKRRPVDGHGSPHGPRCQTTAELACC